MAFILFSFIVFAFSVTAHEDVGCDGGECPDASQVKPRSGSAMLQKQRQAVLSQKKERSMKAKSNATDDFMTPQDLMTCNAEIAYTTPCMTSNTYEVILGEVEEILDEELSKACNASHCEQADWAGCILRMAGHDFMDYVSGSGGSDACTDMNNDDNAGLAACLSEGEFGFSLNSIYPAFCAEISLADFVVIAAQAVMSLLATEANRETLRQGLKDNFRYGRTTLTGDACKSATHWEENPLLPNPAGGCGEVERVFVTNMGLTWKEATALMGVHSLGRAKVENSGYNGYWDTPEHSRTFNNHYFNTMISAGWCPELNVNGNPDKHQWIRCDVGVDQFSHKEMMLNTDMCLAYTDFVGGSLIAGEPMSNCCAWVHTMVGGEERPHGSFPMEDVVRNNDDTFCNVKCGESFVAKHNGQETVMDCFADTKGQAATEKFGCCEVMIEDLGAAGRDDFMDCQTPGLGDPELDPGDKAPAIEFVRQFAANEMEWITSFLTAWAKAVDNGFADSLKPLADSCVQGECKKFCAMSTAPWSDRCDWEYCAGCAECR